MAFSVEEVSMKSKITHTLKISFVIVVLVFLGQKGFISLEATQRAFQNTSSIAIAYCAFLSTTFLAMYRWNLLLKAQKIHLSLHKVFQLTLIGMFFNIALPGAVSGDIVKAIYVGKEAPGKRAYAFSSILFDRVAGVSALILISAFSLIFGSKSDLGDELFNTLQWLVGGLGAGVILFFLYWLAVKKEKDPAYLLLKKIEIKNKVFHSIFRTYDGLRAYQQERKTVFISLAISALIHICVIIGFKFLTQALGLELPWMGLFAVVPLGLLFTAIPILPAGVGTGHAAFIALFQLLGSERGADTFNLFVLTNIALGLIGGLVYLRFKSSGIALNAEEMEIN
ncbi:MAG: hypothetical protein CL678_10905 [Bdellovibrionaceae bacterium]|nr:hypothetical protein [Pseudobdellovibrionaceae bacterium]